MAEGERTKERKIGSREIRALPPNTEIFDAGPGAVPAFGARRRAGRVVSYFVMFRTGEGRLRRFTIGQHGAPWTPDAARQKALSVLSDAKAKGRRPGSGQAGQASRVTVAELCRDYLADADAGRLLVRGGRPKKPLTLVSDRGRIEGHIVPLLGRLPVAAVTKQDVERFMHDVAGGRTAQSRKTKPRGVSNLRGGRGVAGRSVSLLGAIFSHARFSRTVIEALRVGHPEALQ